MYLLKNAKKRSASTLSEEESSEDDTGWAPLAHKQGKPGAKGRKIKQLKTKVHTHAHEHTYAHSHIHTLPRAGQSQA
jgi:hypothetical protein